MKEYNVSWEDLNERLERKCSKCSHKLSEVKYCKHFHYKPMITFEKRRCKCPFYKT